MAPSTCWTMQGLDALEQAVQEAIKPTKIELHNEIHPFWHPDRWPVGFDYSKVFLSARLASKYIESPAGLWFCHAMFFGAREGIDQTRVAAKQCKRRARVRARFARAQDLDEEAKLAVKSKLLEISQHVRHRVKELEGSYGVTYLCPRVPGRTIIAYDRMQIEPLFAEKTNSDQRTAEIVFLALLMVHEFSHVVGIAVHGRLVFEDFFEESDSAELGYELVARLLGGVPHREIGQDGRPLMLLEWPSRLVMMKTDRTHHSLDAYAVPVKPLHWKVPRFFCRLMLTDDFWDKIVPAEGPEALIPEPIARYCLERSLTGLQARVPSSIAQLFRGRTSLSRYHLQLRQVEEQVSRKLKKQPAT